MLLRNEMKNQTSELLYDASEREILNRLYVAQIPLGTELLELDAFNEKINGGPLLQETLLNFGSELSLEDLDSIYSSLLNEARIKAKSVINIVSAEGVVLKTTRKDKLSLWGTINTEMIPIKMDESENIQAVIINPYVAIFREQGILIIATVIMVILVGYCITYQIKIIIKQDKIAKLREDFSYAMIHDMKTPISSMLMGVNVLKSGKLEDKPDKKEKYLRIMGEEATHLLALANRVLTIAKAEESNLSLDIHSISIQAMIENLIEKFMAKTTKQVTFTMNIQNKEIYADVDYLMDAISNLIDNAIKYSGEKVHIEITCLDRDEFTRISVRDDGFGVSPKDQIKIFEKFERAAAIKRNRKGGAAGFGLGLNYVMLVAEAHGGTVDIESIEGEYSEFTINIPKLIEEL